MKSTGNTFLFSKHRVYTKRDKWSIEKKMTIATVCVVLGGFVTFGGVLAKISQLNGYMENTNKMREQIAELKIQVPIIAQDVQDVKIITRNIETYLLSAKNENNHPKR